MRSVVTGGAGFIGSHLVERLLADGAEVTVLDSFTRGRERNLASVAADRRLRIVKADIRDARAIAPAFEGADQVHHLAALADIVPSITDPMEYFTTNVDGTVNVLQAARAAGVKRFVYIASSTCYGIPDVYPTPETAPIRTEYPYALTKHLGELCALHWGRVYGLPVVSLRLFNVYGPRSRTGGTYGAVLGVFLAQRLNGRPLTIVGDGTQTRDFTYVTDVVDAMVTVAAHTEVRDEIFNVGSGGTYSVNELAERIGGERVYVPKRPGEPDCTYADIGKIRSRLGWRPKVTFAEGVERLVARLEDWSEAPVWTPDSIREATADWFRYLSK